MRRGALAAAALVLVVTRLVSESHAATAAPSPDAAAWWSHIQVLSADSMRGRMTGTEDYLHAARYVAERFREYGAVPAGDSPRRTDADAYFQNVPFVYHKIRESECSVSLWRGDTKLPFVLGTDGYLPATVESADTIDAGLVFVGYGLSVPELGYSDLKGVDLRGKIAVYFRSGPDTLPPTVRSHAQSTDVRWSGLRDAGAVGYIVVAPGMRRGGGWQRALKQRLQPGLSLADPKLDPLGGAKFTMRISPAYFDSVLVGSGHTTEELIALNERHVPIPAFPLKVHVSARVRSDRKLVSSPNVVAIIPGSDPVLRKQYVVVSAHLDHLGIGAPVKGDSIFNGAMDNASGVASVIEFARHARAMKRPFRRSIVLLAVTGEEEQLFGSWWYAARPTVPAGAIVADINLDMFLPILPMRVITVYGRTESDLGARFAAVAARAGVGVEDDPDPRRNYFIRSDQYSFIRKGVPSLFFEVGAGSDTAATSKLAAWNRDHYHDVTDDVSQPVDLEVAAAFTHLLYDFTRDVANAPEKPKWAKGSFFARFAARPAARMGTSRHGTARRR